MLEKAAERWSLRLRIFLFFALIAAGTAAILAIAFFLLGRELPPPAVSHLVLYGGGAGFAIIGLVLWVWIKFDDHVARPVEALARDLHAAVHAGSEKLPDAERARYLGQLAPGIAEASEALQEARERVDTAITNATARAERQKKRLETVLRDLQQGVIICRLDHTVLLYNRAAQHFVAHAAAGAGSAPGGELGLGRKLTSLIARQPLRHTLDRLTRRFEGGRHLAHHDGLMAPFLAATATGHETMKGRMSLVLDEDDASPIGYVVTFDRVTEELAAGIWRERLLQDVAQDVRNHITNLTMAGELLLSGQPLSDDEKEQARATIRSEPRILGERLDRLDQVANDIFAAAWPVAPVFSATLFDSAATRRSEDRAITVEQRGTPVWITCDSASVSELIDRIMNRAAVWDQVRDFRLETERNGERIYVDIVWRGQVVPESLVEEWLREPLDESLGAMTGRDVLTHHKTDLWCEAVPESDGEVRIRLPLAISSELEDRPAKSSVAIPERPEFYDFDLFTRHPPGALDDMPLKALSYVVFDTETTGLEPSRGDEMVSVAGVRIVNGRVLRGEIFSSFINPGRRIPAGAAKIHGITDAMVAEAPDVSAVLPRFHDFVGDGVLVAHNAPFDMAFLKKRQTDAGLVFDQPVLDTVLLAAHVFGRADSLTLDALAERFNVVIAPEDRHTALGDALATADVLLKLFDLLEPLGVATLGDAIRAADRQAAIRRKQSAY